MVYGDLRQSGWSVWIINNISSFAVDPETVGQFTGLYDKNGKEVYEGDIFTSGEYPFTDDANKNYVGVVEYEEESLCWHYDFVKISNRVRGGAVGDRLCDVESDIEVIGNIHQNPELLEIRSDEQ
jgi:uncharacterized phage protein (TIGR01671 family)